MSTRMFLSLIDASQPLSLNVVPSLQQFGAFRLAAPQLSQPLCDNVFSMAKSFFDKDIKTKVTTAGYSAFRAERVRGKIAIPKESIYLFQTSASNGLQNPPADLVSSVEALHKNWMLLREDLLQGISPSAKNTSLGDDTVGVHYYDNQQLNVDDNHFNPPHKDSGLFTVLLQKPGDDLLEIAGLDSTEQTGSETIGKRTAFWPVSFMPGEVIVLAGKGLERLLGSDRVRACVHRVRKPATKNIVSRLSIAIFCSPPAGSLTPGTLI